MIGFVVLYTAFLALGSCLWRAHGGLPDPPSAQHAQVDTTEAPEEPDTALAVTFSPGGSD